jgi:hypothetical protein
MNSALEIKCWPCHMTRSSIIDMFNCRNNNKSILTLNLQVKVIITWPYALFPYGMILLPVDVVMHSLLVMGHSLTRCYHK